MLQYLHIVLKMLNVKILSQYLIILKTIQMETLFFWAVDGIPRLRIRVLTLMFKTFLFGQDDISKRFKFADNYFILPSSGLDHSVVKNSNGNQQNSFNGDSTTTNSNNSTSYSFQTISS